MYIYAAGWVDGWLVGWSEWTIKRYKNGGSVEWTGAAALNFPKGEERESLVEYRRLGVLLVS